MSNPLVSLIIPCYNAEKYIGRMLDSIIMQHYTPFELILINDGSTDNTDAVIQQYLPLLKKNSIDVVYKIQENQGVGATIDNGLKLFTGDYLCWADADDYFEPDAFIERVNFLEKHPEYAIVTSDAYYRPAEKLNELKKASGGYPNRYEENQFAAMIIDKSICCPGCHMVRASDFLTVNPLRSIYRSRGGQNWQMLLPIYYKFKRVFLDKPLYNYVIYPSSHSHGDSTLQDKLNRIDGHEDIICETLKMIEQTQNVDLTEYHNMSQRLFRQRRMTVYCDFGKSDLFYKELKQQRKSGKLTYNDYILILRMILGKRISLFIYKLLHPAGLFK